MTQQQILEAIRDMKQRFERIVSEQRGGYCPGECADYENGRGAGSDAAYEDAAAGIQDLIAKIEKDADPVLRLLSQTHADLADIQIEYLADRLLFSDDRARFIRLAKARRDDAPYIAHGATPSSDCDGTG